jgi:hypothetical protein
MCDRSNDGNAAPSSPTSNASDTLPSDGLKTEPWLTKDDAPFMTMDETYYPIARALDLTPLSGRDKGGARLRPQSHSTRTNRKTRFGIAF